MSAAASEDRPGPTAGDRWRRAGAIGGVAGPAAFVATWATLSATTAGYSALDDPISRLAALHAPTRPAMTAGLVALSVGVAAYGRGLRPAHPAASVAAIASAVGTLAIAVTPLDSALGGNAHAAAAGAAYVTLAAIPALVARDRRRSGDRAGARRAGTVAAATAAALAVQVLGAPQSGGWQRLGLTIGHAWIAASAVALWRADRRATGRRAAPAAEALAPEPLLASD